MKRLVVSALLACATIAAPAGAAVTFTFAQVGNNVVLTGSGSLNLAGASVLGTVRSNGFVNSSAGSLAVGGVAGNPVTNGASYFLTSTAGAFGTSAFTEGSPDVGPIIGLDGRATGGFVYVPIGYVSGTALNATTTFANRTLASLGLRAGTYTYRIPNDTIAVIVPAAAVPEPATWAMMIGGFGLVGGAMRRRRRALVAA